MITRDQSRKTDDVSLAMEQVLGAEREARDAVAASRAEADAMIEAARETARRIEARADARMAAAHRLCADRTAAAVEQIMATLHGESAESEQWDDALIAEAVAVLAARMTGGDGGADA